MTLFNGLIVILSLLAAPAFICRLDALHFKQHGSAVVLMHLVMAIAVAWGGGNAWMGLADIGDLCSVLGPSLWIWISYGSWIYGVPDHFSKT